MDAVTAIKNQYQGINAHLHSFFQAKGGWNGFHTLHIGHLAVALKAKLFPMGYTAEIEPSLQIRRLDKPSQNPESDILIFDKDKLRPQSSPPTPLATTATLVMPTVAILSVLPKSEKEYAAIRVYQRSQHLGRPVAWIELLSPSNKTNRHDLEIYQSKRQQILEQGIVFMEIDYLHESSPTIPKIPDYRTRKNRVGHPNAHPYRIALIDPRPDIYTGHAQIVEFDVDKPIPVITIPLSGADTLEFDFGAVYNQSFEAMLYGLENIDYRQMPLHFDRYSPTDQARIAARMVAILNAHQHGISLENTPLPVEPMSLEEGLTQLTRLDVIIPAL
jgi:hypothetical protein